MSFSDEIVYAIVLFSSVAAGLYVRSIPSPWLKQMLPSVFGIATIICLCGMESLHSVAALLGTLLVIKSHNKQTPLLAFGFVFSYLLFFRCSTLFGLPAPSAIANAVQLLLTLKLISVAIEIHDYRQKKREGAKEDMQTRFQLSLNEEPGVYDIICYSYCYIGIFTGPFFKFRTYSDFLKQSPKESSTIPWQEQVTYRIKYVTIFALLFLITSQLFSVDYVKSDGFYDLSFWLRLLYMVPIFFMARMRFYLAWLLAECSCITAGLGAYPEGDKPRSGHGPTIEIDQSRLQGSDVKYSFETIRNINPGGSDWSKTVREGMRNWNMTVQWWLANYVHKRWPPHLKQFRTAAVLAVSAYWHGIAPGYFGAFLTMPFIMMAEDLMIATVKKRLSPRLQEGYDWANWFFKMRSFEYMFMAFALLTWEDTYRWWKSVYFIGHISCLVIIVACTLARNFLRTRKKDEARKNE